MDPSLIASAAQQGIGAIQSVIGAIQAKKYQKQLEKMQSPTYSANRGILDYYNQALARYNVNPTETALYKRQTRDIDRGMASGIASLQDRRSGTAGASSIFRAANDARLDANVAAEEQRNQRFGDLGQATGMKAGEERTAFDINQMQPFERKYNLLAMRAGAANQTTNTGMSNIFNGLQNYQMMDYLKGGQYGGGNRMKKSANALAGN